MTEGVVMVAACSGRKTTRSRGYKYERLLTWSNRSRRIEMSSSEEINISLINE